ncbi:hypothetical protein [Streptomyces flavofungini]|uniref:Regulatory protein n=1 Tax=Streptomyces flavofungini TaxID=68200 RepID=A0ABS0XJT2_9ACTN|nr:hypothetical protein [Streptomyces flavofungini]MBJ3813201.1 hypothetical protein [Streptomyces flavofungini]GHC90183.1 hypothetical protein GCM10010349_78340 [Streptomyces flavofungini]
MTETVSTPTALASQYATQVSSDLERNVKEQERIRAEIDSLQEQLAALHHDHTVLTNIRQALELATPPAATDEAPDGASVVPAPRGKASAAASRSKQSATRQAGSPQRRATGGKQARKPAAVKAAEPTLVELISRHLAVQSEPRSAAEIATDLGQAHPDRGIKTTVVRTTLENLVAKNRAQRSKQGTSVFYTAPDAPAQPAAPEEQPRSSQAE